MKKAKLITSLSSIAFVGTVAPIASTAFTTSKNSTTVKTNSLTAANAKSLDDLGWIKRSQTTSNNTSTIRAEIVSDNNIIFTKYRDLKKNITITVTETSTKNVFLASITSLDQSKYSGGPVTWNITYLPPEPEPEPPAYNAVTYDELVALKEAGELIAGAQYRIVDYQCTCNGTVNGVADVAQATNHPFDICVTATGAKTLNENAMAIKNAADESSTGTKYFTNNDLDAWEIKYCLDNDTSRFEWASSSGKGVVYYMKDEFGNEASYDFKNIQFKRYMITGVADPTVTADGLVDGYFSPTTSRSDYNVSDTDYIWTYTFGNYSKANPADLSLDKSNNIYNNVIKETESSDKKLVLNNIVFLGVGSFENSFETGCYNNTFRNNCVDNVFDNLCHDNIVFTYFMKNTIGNNSNNNVFDHGCQNNTLGNATSGIIMGNMCSYNTFGNNSGNNRLGDYCQYNTFGNMCNSIYLATAYKEETPLISRNTFGDGCRYIQIKVGSADAYYQFTENHVYNTYRTSQNWWILDLATKGINKVGATYIDGVEQPKTPAISDSYANIKQLKDKGNLVINQQYRINDYEAKVDQTTYANLASAATTQYPFDIIVTADTESSFLESVTIQARSGVSYATESKFSAWTVLYSFDNDAERFDWADTTDGKGVIYYMKDENDNEAPYDYKNILFTPYGSTGTPNKYTFDNGSGADASLTGDAYENTIAPYRFVGKTISLNNIVFNGTGSFGNTFDTDCHDIVFGASCTSNKFGKECANDTFCGSCSDNTIGNSFINNSFKNSINGNTFNNSVTNITVNAPASGRGLSTVLLKNDFGSGVNHITFANNIQFTKNTILSTGSAESPLAINANMENKLIVDGKVVDGQGEYAINAVTWNGAQPVAGSTAVSNPLVLHDRFGNSISSGVTWKASTIEGDAESYIESDSTGKPVLKVIMGQDTEYCKINLSAYVDDTKVTSIKVTVSPENQMVYDPGDGTDVEVILADDMDISKLGGTGSDFIFTTKEGETITITSSQRSNIKSIKITSVKDGTTATPTDFLGYCTNLKSVDLSGLSEITLINGHFLFNSAITTLDLSKLTKIQEIKDSFLNSCRSLAELKLPTSCPVTTIGKYFLEYCSSLKSLNLSGFTSLSSIDQEFLYGDTALKRIDLPDTSATSITVTATNFMTNVPTNIPMYARADLVGDYDAGTGYKGTAPWSTRHEQITARPQ